jgi:hypothetical protein
MRISFFRRAAKKSIIHGISLGLLQIGFHLLEQNAPKDDSDFMIQLKLIIQYLALPELATLGSEHLMHSLFGTPFYGNLATRNLVITIIPSLILPIDINLSRPFTLYALGVMDYLTKDTELEASVDAKIIQAVSCRKPT